MKRRSNKVDSNNNIVNCIVDLSQTNGSTIAIGGIVWIKHNQCLDTPVIVQNILIGKKNEMVRPIFINQFENYYRRL